MTDVNTIFIVDVHPSEAKLTFLLDGDCFLITSTVSQYFFQQMMLRVLADGSTTSPHNGLNHCRNSRLAIAFNRP